MDIDTPIPATLTPSVTSQIQTPHNVRLHAETQKLASMINALVEYQIANPAPSAPASRSDIDASKAIDIEIEKKKKLIKAQLAFIRPLFRASVMKVREEKALTAESRNVNDTLLLQLGNLKYEERSLEGEISAAENFDHKFTKLPLIPVEEFLALHPELAELPEHDIMTARIEHEYQVRVKLEERRQEKLKQKQMLIAEVKKRKDDLTRLDGMVENFIEAAKPIEKALAME